jgi:hypothetical protein
MSPKRVGPSLPDPREKPSPQQMAHVIRFNLNWQWTAVNLQHERLVSNVLSCDDLVEASMRKHLTGMVTAVPRSLCESEDGEGPVHGACGPSGGLGDVGDVGAAGHAECADGEVAEGCHGPGT